MQQIRPVPFSLNQDLNNFVEFGEFGRPCCRKGSSELDGLDGVDSRSSISEFAVSPDP